MKIEEPVVQALLRLRGREFEPLIEYLTGLRDEQADRLLHAADATVIYRQQGRVQQLDEFLTLVSDVEKLADKFRR